MQLSDANRLAQRYRDMYLTEKGGKSADGDRVSHKSVYSGNDNVSHVSDADLQDDEALFKRRVAKLASMKSMITTTPIRLEDIIRKNEVCSMKMQSTLINLAKGVHG